MSADLALAFAAALAHHEAGRIDQAETLYRAILTDQPNHPDSLHLLGLITAQTGKPEAGAAMIRQAMALAPGRAPHHNSLAAAYRLLGRDAEAVEQYRAAAKLRPDSAEIHNNLATALHALGRHQEAVAEYRRAVTCAPTSAQIWCNLASALAEHGQPPDVEDCFHHAIRLNPDFSDALANYGRWLITQARWLEAEVWLQDAVRLADGDARTWNNLGIAQQEVGRPAQAEQSYRRAAALDPLCADAQYNLGCLLTEAGRTDAAIACHRAALAADPLHGAARLALCMAHLPVLYRSQAEVAVRRARYLTALCELTAAVADPDVAKSVALAVGTARPFFLPYQGHNDLVPQAAYGGLVCGLRHAADPASPRAAPPAGGARIRLGIVSGCFCDHTVFRLFLDGWLRELDRDRFEVTAFHTGRINDEYTKHCAELCDRFECGWRTPEAWRAAVCGMAPDVLLYPEVGIDPVAAFLAAHRLAPIQCVAWGHPETTGLPTIDYFLSSALMEPADADTHYTEQLVRLPGLGVHYTPDEPPAALLDRAALGLDPEVPVYWSGQALYKYLPAYDAIYPRIAKAVGACQFVFIAFAKSEAVTAAFRERLRGAFAAFGLEAERYCVVLPPLPQPRFIAAVGLADVVLDTPGWSGGRSTLDCLAQNPAIVTWPGPLMRSRHTAAVLQRIGCTATIAASLDDYVALAVRLGRNPVWRAEIRAQVALHKHHAFRDAGAVRALETFLASTVARLRGDRQSMPVP